VCVAVFTEASWDGCIDKGALVISEDAKF